MNSMFISFECMKSQHKYRLNLFYQNSKQFFGLFGAKSITHLIETKISEEIIDDMASHQVIHQIFKDKRSLLFEILYSLEGIDGDLVDKVVDNQHMNRCKQFDWSESQMNGSIGLSEINLIDILLVLSNNYLIITKFIRHFGSDANPYNRQLAQTMDKLMTDYRNDLIEVEMDLHRDIDYSLIKFNKFLKYCQTFDFLHHIINQFNKSPQSFATTLDFLKDNSLSGFSQIQKCAKMIYENSDTLYSDIWSWIMFGFLSHKTDNYFFIKEDNNKTVLDMSRVPPFMKPEDANKVHQIGESVRLAQSRGIPFIYKERVNEMFDRFNDMKNKSSTDKNSFTQFIEFVRQIVSEENWKYVMNVEKLKHHLKTIKSFYLMANDNFWSCFVSHISLIELNGHKRYRIDVETAFQKTLHQVFNENEVNEVLSNFSIVTSEEPKDYTISLNYKIPTYLQTIISNLCFDKYNKIMSFMLNIYLLRYQLNQIWLKIIKCKTRGTYLSSVQLKALTLRNSLSYMINAFFYYFKVLQVDVIERHFRCFTDKIEKTRDIEDIQKDHQILLSDIIGQLFLKTSVIYKCLEQLYSLCEQLKTNDNNEEALNSLIESFDRLKVQIYHLLANLETYKTNQMLSKLVVELEKCSKQEILFS
ncbi:gamma-tubulin complex component 4 homolog [Oppia nitens]|uniref:gamma-tubulin complex component 4 homolog n=1 Tax=Oppia nitens TaxID=1686743 RepID=UPI0023DB5A0F|nr:gamma-tubulin complex component 4 homolog [Oppia nitens]